MFVEIVRNDKCINKLLIIIINNEIHACFSNAAYDNLAANMQSANDNMKQMVYAKLVYAKVG